MQRDGFQPFWDVGLADVPDRSKMEGELESEIS